MWGKQDGGNAAVKCDDGQQRSEQWRKQNGERSASKKENTELEADLTARWGQRLLNSRARESTQKERKENGPWLPGL